MTFISTTFLLTLKCCNFSHYSITTCSLSILFLTCLAITLKYNSRILHSTNVWNNYLVSLCTVSWNPNLSVIFPYFIMVYSKHPLLLTIHFFSHNWMVSSCNIESQFKSNCVCLNINVLTYRWRLENRCIFIPTLKKTVVLEFRMIPLNYPKVSVLISLQCNKSISRLLFSLQNAIENMNFFFIRVFLYLYCWVAHLYSNRQCSSFM